MEKVAFGICYIFKEFNVQIRHLENIILQRLQGISYLYKVRIVILPQQSWRTVGKIRALLLITNIINKFLIADGGEYRWKGTFEQLETYFADNLPGAGSWSSSSGGVKLFTAEDFQIK